MHLWEFYTYLALLGYCPGTIAGAVGNGYLDAAVGGILGILVGSGIFAAYYPKLKEGILQKGNYGDVSLPKLLKVNDWVVVIPVSILVIALLYWIESMGLQALGLYRRQYGYIGGIL